MALREEPGSSRSLVRSRHCCGDLLAYFLSPGTAWELRFEDVVTQVLKENRRYLKMKHAKVATSLGIATDVGLTYVGSSMPHQRPCRWSLTGHQAWSWNTG